MITPLLDEHALAELSRDRNQRVRRYAELVRAHYGGATDLYRHVWGDSFHFALWADPTGELDAVRYTERRIAELAGFARGDQVLDVGCGIGGPALTVAEVSGAHVTGVDLLERHVELATQRARERGLANRTRFLHADAMLLPFPAGCFDHVYTFEAGCHAPSTAAFVRECARVLRPGGVFTGTDWIAADDLDAEAWDRWIEPVCRWFALPALATRKRMDAALRAAGLTVRALEIVPARPERTTHWGPVQLELLDGWAQSPHSPAPPGVQRMAHGGRALAAAAHADALVVGYWRATT